jgi:hypothetical protein
MKDLCSFTADLLSVCGGLVENTGDGLEILLPPDTAKALEVPEHTRLSFSMNGEDGIFVSYESNLFRNMGWLLNDRGRFCIVNVPAFPVNIEKLEERLAQKVVLQNAIFHFERREQKAISYLLAFFKYTAFSDERQEGVIASLMNEFNFSVRGMQTDPFQILVDAVEGPLEDVEREGAEKTFKTLYRAQQEIVKETLQEFIRSLERRLNRDIHRVNDYYRTLAQETQQVIEKRVTSEVEREKAQNKIEMIETERKWKVQDLISKYSLRVQLEPISLIRIETVAPVFWLLIKRRKGTRSFPLIYNPILKVLDPFPCEACYYPQKIHSLCDDKLHIVCSRCFRTCPKCGKEYCTACHPPGCPRCGPYT